MESDSEVNEAFDEAVGECVVTLSEELRTILNKHRVWVKGWIGRRETLGALSTLFHELSVEYPLEYKGQLRMTVEQFNELLSLLEPKIAKRDTIMRNAITARQKLKVTLRYLASGDSFQSLALLFRIPATTISRFLPEVLQAIINVLQPYLKVPQTLDEWRQIQNSFEIKWNFSSCCGALDGKHIAIKRPPGTCAEFYNYKGDYNIILLALVDVDCKFIYIDVGTNGRANDGSVVRLSTLKRAIDKNSLNLPRDYVIVADDAFPLSPNLMEPFSRRNLSLVERIFNYRLSRARRVVENAFGILAARFRVFRKDIEGDISTVDLIVQAACSIHNWLGTVSPGTYFERGWADYEETETGVLHSGQWRTTGTELPSVRSVCTSTYSKQASEKRKNGCLFQPRRTSSLANEGYRNVNMVKGD